MNSTLINRHRERAAAAVLLAVITVAALALAASLWPVLAHRTGTVLTAAAAVTVLAVAGRWVLRVRQYRREDREDAHIAAAWRAAHQSAGSSARSEREVA